MSKHEIRVTLSETHHAILTMMKIEMDCSTGDMARQLIDEAIMTRIEKGEYYVSTIKG